MEVPLVSSVANLYKENMSDHDSFGSGMAYPVPWYWIPYNIFSIFCVAVGTLFNRRLGRVIKEITQATGIKIMTAADFMGKIPKSKLLLGCCSEIDFPVEVMVENIIPCGPIVRPAPPVTRVDPELAIWLERGPTVFINLGTLCKYSESAALQMAKSVRLLLDSAANRSDMTALQVLWKLKKEGNYSTDRGSEIFSILMREIEQDRVRIIPWVAPEPLAVLQTGNIICSVNHGGAGAYNDAIW